MVILHVNIIFNPYLVQRQRDEAARQARESKANAALLEKAAAAEAAEAAKAKRVREAAAREACQYDDPSNAYSPLGTDADTDFGDTDTEDSNDDATTVLPHLLPPPSYHDPSPCAPR